MQSPDFTGGPNLWVLDRFKVLDMREAENAAHHLRACKSNGIRKDPGHGSQPISLKRLRAGRISEKFGYKCIASCGFAPKRKEFRFELIPDRLNGVEQPTAVGGNRIGLAGVTALRDIAEHEIRENGADVKTY